MRRASVDRDTGHASLVARRPRPARRRHEADVPTAAERSEEKIKSSGEESFQKDGTWAVATPPA
jgi:hypothetical protein